MPVIYTRRQIESLVRRQMTNSNLLRQALSVTNKRIHHLPSEEISDLEKFTSLKRLDTAMFLLRQPQNEGDLKSQVLLPYYGNSAGAINLFVRIEKFSTLGSLVDLDFEEILTALNQFKIKNFTALRTFYEVYQELAAERTVQAA